jgi:hypothetical protein
VVLTPAPLSADVKEKVELYIYFCSVFVLSSFISAYSECSSCTALGNIKRAQTGNHLNFIIVSTIIIIVTAIELSLGGSRLHTNT